MCSTISAPICSRRTGGLSTTLFRSGKVFAMPSVTDILNAAVERALGAPAMLRAADPRFGDYQANGVMAVAKQRKINPRQLADEIVGKLDLGEVCERPTVAGAGFINFKLKSDFVARQ